MKNDEHLTRINVKVRLKNDDAKFFGKLLDLNDENGKTSQELIQFIFNVGLSFISGNFKGASLAQAMNFISGMSRKIDVDKVILNGKEAEFNTTTRKEIMFKYNKKWNRLKLQYKGATVPLIKKVGGVIKWGDHG